MSYEYLPIEQAKPGDVVEYCGLGSEYINESRVHIVSKDGLRNKNSLGVIDKSGNNQNYKELEMKRQKEFDLLIVEDNPSDAESIWIMLSNCQRKIKTITAQIFKNNHN